MKIHVEYEADLDRVPLDGWGCYYFGEDINSILLCTETYERGKIWFAPETLAKLFGACNMCGINTKRCLGHEVKNTGIKRPTAAENNAAAQARIAQRGKKKFSFTK